VHYSTLIEATVGIGVNTHKAKKKKKEDTRLKEGALSL
jgi:hypothetical protein